MNTKIKILLLEDEVNLGQTLLEYFNEKNFICELATTIASASALATTFRPDVFLLDIGLPDGNGLDFARTIKPQFKNALILFLSAHNDPQIRLEGLEIGADDYITKPFALKELSLRLMRMLKMHSSLHEHELHFGKLKMNLKSYELTDARGLVLSLGQKECAILSLLFNAQNEVVSRDTIIDMVWGQEQYPSPRTVDNYIVKLRKWCESDPHSPIQIVSVRGIGYKLTRQ